ncbi:hypothetical protein KR059_006187 [Drosophila kikkawai]|nr:hypothetical protein KR059_006187 [Drosophila kikkawai]
MSEFETNLLCLLAAWSLWNGCVAEDQHSGYVCLIDDPKPNQYDNFCIAALQPLLDQITRRLDKGNTQVDILVGQQAKLESQLEKVLEVQKIINNQLQAVLEAQQAALVETRNMMKFKVPSNFEQIGSRYFLIVERRQDWSSAEIVCLRMGGYLALIQSLEELTAINAKLKGSSAYWLGINDQLKEGHYISVASNKTAEFLDWSPSLSGDEQHTQNCVYLLEGFMSYFHCDFPAYFICQADKEI